MNTFVLKIALATVAILFVASPGFSEEMKLRLQRHHFIVDPAGGVRFLMGFPSASSLSEEWISSATLEVPLTGVSLANDLEVELDLLDRGWGNDATWTRPWSNPGGDRNDRQALSVSFLAGQSPARLEFDVTNMMRAAISGDVPWNGFILHPLAGDAKSGFDLQDRATLGAMSDATLTVRYRSLTELGMRGGVDRQLARQAARRSRTAPDEGHPRR